jgi:transmembrane sensor
LTKRDSGAWGASDEAALQAWLASSTANRIAFLRLESAWEETLRLKALVAGVPKGCGASLDWRMPISFEERSVERVKKREGAGLLAVAAVALFAVIGSAYLGFKLIPGDRYATPVGGMASVPLQDGSNITLNTASKIRVELSERERHIDLARGEAYFDVAKDAARPFVVSVGNKRVIAVGTKFSVRRDRDDVRVVVTEGKVKIEDLDRQESEFLVAAGGIAKTGDSGVVVQKRTIVETEEILSWRKGYLTFYDTPLIDAVAEFNQYNTDKIRISDPAVAAIPLTGKFRATNAEAFVRLLEDGYSIHTRRTDGKIILTAQ